MSQNTFFSSDHHWGHNNIIRHCNRPFNSIEEHDEALIDNWNKTVSRSDLVYYLGDFAMIPKQDDGTPRMTIYKRLRHRLNGKIILAGVGNHDQMSQEVYSLFSGVHPILERNIAGHTFTMCHYPMLEWNRSFHNKKDKNNKKYSIMLHGHCHNRLQRHNPFRVDVGIDGWDYKPIVLEDLLKDIEYWKEKLADKFFKTEFTQNNGGYNGTNY